MKRISLSANAYADSLVQTDLSADVVLENLNFVNNTLKTSADLLQTMMNPTISSNIKIDIINEIFKSNLDDKIKNFLKILIDKDRFGELQQIIEAYAEKIDEINKVMRADIISAVELDENQKKQIYEKLNKRLNRSIIPNWIVDESIIGGLVIKYSDNIIDSSLKTKLNMFSKK